MKRIFLGIITAGMLAACHQSNKTQQSNTTTETTVSAPGTTPAGAPVDTANAPIIRFEKDSYNFGKINQGDKVSYDFKFTNAGKTPLIITDAVASCGCTKPDWPKEPIKPGDKGVIKVVFNSAGKDGLQDKLITITGNTVPTQSVVHLVGEVIAPKSAK
ncbi:DUF1573 domain-containing protein [Mucilaginibacter paludis]|uniref:DUF1573 domain-containing protein n=1 Tax=Mucilaginibacter paludis DSM 18603 TaxID=714943 RepID=H1Y7D8_9SPHI|nr:DUF1573 domain-containing protein [Mucilaginibacter paludis]EHQ29025.1 protein of unknown function DUF1573 [Mucilaginibacter paludis DSM 18603]